jgi:hypothetical protein
MKNAERKKAEAHLDEPPGIEEHVSTTINYFVAPARHACSQSGTGVAVAVATAVYTMLYGYESLLCRCSTGWDRCQLDRGEVPRVDRDNFNLREITR